MPVQRIPISAIKMHDEKLLPYVRESFSDAHTKEMVAFLSNGGTLPPIVVTKSGGKGKYILIDGNHRLMAYSGMGQTEVDAEVLDVSLADAGFLQITLQDKGRRITKGERNAYVRFLYKKGVFTQEMIAERLHLSQSTVSRILTPPKPKPKKGGGSSDDPALETARKAISFLATNLTTAPILKEWSQRYGRPLLENLQKVLKEVLGG